MQIPTQAQKILEQGTIQLKLDRIAFEILEHTFGVNEITFIGIQEGGYVMASILQQLVEQYDANKKITLCSLTINKPEPLSEKVILNPDVDLSQKHIVLIDDVANTGKTLFYAFQRIIRYPIQHLTTCVLVDRTHKKFPIKSDIVGFQMATTYNEHIIVQLDGTTIEGVYLF